MAVQVPSHKSDMDAVATLQDATPAELLPHVRELLGWLQDSNWPVARGVAAALPRLGDDLVEPVREILQGTDEVWKYWLLHTVIRDLPEASRARLQPEIERMAMHPSASERAEEVDQAARELLGWPPP